MAAAGNLLHHLTRDLRPARNGRAGLPVHQRVTPSAGGLHPYAFVCLGDRDGRVMLYDEAEHSFRPLEADHADLTALNAVQVEEMLGRAPGVTARIIMDRSLVAAAYNNPDTLLLRDAGALLAVASMLAEWLGLLACPLGFMGGDFVERLRLPADRFIAAGGFQISTEAPRS